MEQNPGVQRLRALELKRIELLKKYKGDPPDEEEDPILDEMDDAWWAMSEEGRDHCYKPGPNHAETVYWIDQADK